MKLEEAISKALDMDLELDTNIYKIAVRQDKAWFLTDCDASTCRAISASRKREELAIAILEEITAVLVNGRVKDSLTQAMEILKEGR